MLLEEGSLALGVEAVDALLLLEQEQRVPGSAVGGREGVRAALGPLSLLGLLGGQRVAGQVDLGVLLEGAVQVAG